MYFWAIVDSDTSWIVCSFRLGLIRELIGSILFILSTLDKPVGLGSDCNKND